MRVGRGGGIFEEWILGMDGERWVGLGWVGLGWVGLGWVGLSDSGENGVRKNRDDFE